MKKNFIIYGILILYFILNGFVLPSLNLNYYNEFINPLMWIVCCGVAVLLSNDSSLRVKGKQDKIQSLLIVLILYIIFYFLLGLLFGFEKTPYSKDIFSILKNLWSFVGIIFFQEFIREAVLKNSKKSILNFVLITFLMGLIQINFVNFESHFASFRETFIYLSTVIIPSFLESALMTYLVYISGPFAAIIYRLFLTVPPFIVPIIPHLDWFSQAIIGIVLPLATFIYLNYVHTNKSERLSRRERKSYNPASYIPVFIVIFLLAGFVMGLFKYQPIAVLSGSMVPAFDRGDAVVIEKLTKPEKAELKKGDVIQFISGTKYVVHRIVEVSSDEYGNPLFVTKGDANNTMDMDKVPKDQVMGKVACVIPFSGYPSVWLSGVIS